jgi:two-component system phosphate regulon sensor histidine kinase PhoR
MRLRSKILLALISILLIGDLLAVWIVQDRLQIGAEREAANQARARALQVQAVYAERAATLQAEGEAISLYPAVIGALVDHNPVPLRRWSAQVAQLQGKSVTVTDDSGSVVARGHAPDIAGDNLADRLDGLRRALGGERISAAEGGDELGLALRGYVPVLRDGIGGPIVGAVMIADPIASQFLNRLGGGDPPVVEMQVVNGPPAGDELCGAPVGASVTCSVGLGGPAGAPVAHLSFEVPLIDIERARSDAQRGLWLASALVLVLGAAAAWVLARSLTRPLARLTAISKKMGEGDFSEAVLVDDSRDEIGVLAHAFESMRARIAEMTGALRDERDVLDAVLQSTGDGILMVDDDGRTLVANSVWESLTGGAGLIAAGGLQRTDGGSTPETFDDAVRRWLTDRDLVAVAVFERAEPYQQFRVYSAPVRHHGGAVLGRIVVLRDVTRETEAERMRSALVGVVSHELRSPLTAITGYTQTLLNDGPWDEQTEHDFLEVVAVSAQRLSALVDNMLDAATIEAGALRLQREPVRVERIAERVLAQRRLFAGTCSLHLETPASLPLADADPVRVEQVVSNLIENAIKYSPHGGAIRVKVGTDDDGMLVTSVSDHGTGITADDTSRLFEAFYRVESKARSTRGVGLGLYICRCLVESHGGRIWVDSQPGRGSTFAFTLPALSDGLDGGEP